LRRTTPQDALVRGLAEECEKLRNGLVIGCDANAHHTQWGCPNNNDRGESLFDFILNSNLFLCNRGNVPTFITKACQTIIDLTLVSDSLVGAVKNWAVSDEHSFSDCKLYCPLIRPCRSASLTPDEPTGTVTKKI